MGQRNELSGAGMYNDEYNQGRATVVCTNPPEYALNKNIRLVECINKYLRTDHNKKR
ncbi:hypothetical protein GCM10009414_16920 [Tatumella terrea]